MQINYSDYVGNEKSMRLVVSCIQELEMPISEIRNCSKVQTNLYAEDGEARITFEVFNTGTINIKGPDSSAKSKIEMYCLPLYGKIKINIVPYRPYGQKKNIETVGSDF